MVGASHMYGPDTTTLAPSTCPSRSYGFGTLLLLSVLGISRQASPSRGCTEVPRAHRLIVYTRRSTVSTNPSIPFNDDDEWFAEQWIRRADRAAEGEKAQLTTLVPLEPTSATVTIALSSHWFPSTSRGPMQPH